MYDEPNQQGDVQLVVEFSDYDPSLFQLEQSTSTLSLVGDLMISECGIGLNCQLNESFNLKRRVHLKDTNTGNFVDYVDSAEEEFRVEIIDCTQDFIRSSKKKIIHNLSAENDLGNNVFQLSNDGKDFQVELVQPDQHYPDVCGTSSFSLVFNNTEHEQFFQLNDSVIAVTSMELTALTTA